MSMLVAEVCVEVNESFSIYFGKGLPKQNVFLNYCVAFLCLSVMAGCVLF